MVRRRRPAVRAPARSLQSDRHPQVVPARSRPARRRRARRHAPLADPVRDGPAAALLHPARRRADKAAHPERHEDALRLQGIGHALVGESRRPGRRRPRLVVPPTPARRAARPRPPLLLQRTRRHRADGEHVARRRHSGRGTRTERAPMEDALSGWAGWRYGSEGGKVSTFRTPPSAVTTPRADPAPQTGCARSQTKWNVPSMSPMIGAPVSKWIWIVSPRSLAPGLSTLML